MNNYERTYQYIKQYILTNGYPPSMREICKAVGVASTSTVSYYLTQMEADGKIIRNKSKNRSIELTELKNRDNVRTMPILGQIAAGTPILAEENLSGEISFSSSFFKGNELFALRVKGDSMINVGIYDGDWVVINKQSTAQNGEIVAAMIDGSATVKRFYLERNMVRLQPENNFMRPIFSKDVVILGKVVGLIRSMQS
ncbi:MAG: transcriptional repressor LexA [Clostridia bacterium]